MMKYNLHTHTQFCDGRATMNQMAQAANEQGFELLGFTPHSPINVDTHVNMKQEDVPLYLQEIEKLRKEYEGKMKILAGMEIDYLGKEATPEELPKLDYTISSVHFIPSPITGKEIDVDGRPEKFIVKMDESFGNDIEWVVNAFFDRTLEMVEAGGFDIIGHIDKIARNADAFCKGFDKDRMFTRRVTEIIECLADRKDIAVEVNTKFAQETGRFFPAIDFWPLLKKTGLKIYFNSDAHETAKLNSGRDTAIELWNKI